MGDQIAVDPADHAGIHIRDLEHRPRLRIPGPALAVDHLTHPPVTVLGLTGHRVMTHDHGHAGLQAQEDRTRLRWQRLLRRGVVNRHREWNTCS